jgi:hypothetical protein
VQWNNLDEPQECTLNSIEFVVYHPVETIINDPETIIDDLTIVANNIVPHIVYE